MTTSATAPAAQTDPVHPPLRRNRDFTLLVTGSTVSSIGSGMTSLALMLLTVSLTGSPARAGLVTGAFGLGLWLAMLPAGALCDRWNRKTVMVVTPLLGALALGSVPLAAWLWHVTFAQLLLVALVDGVLGCFYSPAEAAAIKGIVPAEQMGTALGVNQARSSAATLVGSPLAGVLYTLGRTLPMLVDALSYLWAAGCAALVRTPLPAPRREQPSNLRADVAQGLRWVWRVPAVRDIVLVGMVINLAINASITVATLWMQQHGVSPTALGTMEAAFGMAGVVGAVATPWVLQHVRVGTAALVGIWAVVVGGMLLPLGTSIWWIGGIVVVMVACIAPLNAGMGAYRMHITPDAMQGRVSSAGNFVALAMLPVGSAVSGFLLEHVGRAPAMLAFAALTLLAGIGCLLSAPIRSMPATRDFDQVPEVA